MTFNAAPQRRGSGTASSITAPFYLCTTYAPAKRSAYACTRKTWRRLARPRPRRAVGARSGAPTRRQHLTIRRRIADGELRSFRLGGAVRVPTSEISRVRGDAERTPV